MTTSNFLTPVRRICWQSCAELPLPANAVCRAEGEKFTMNFTSCRYSQWITLRKNIGIVYSLYRGRVAGRSAHTNKITITG